MAHLRNPENDDCSDIAVIYVEEGSIDDAVIERAKILGMVECDDADRVILADLAVIAKKWLTDEHKITLKKFGVQFDD